ncbi:hypothetical protein DL96DRAFT_482434 [Flagelloscypha sp. PMI_526]|nr:hypothetical protein DL96DRAFT_482434 [Flagelloscypha sp. PMI_526]
MQNAHVSRGIRKKHKKSKAGCRTCRTRHVKCDELKPLCQNCKKRGVDCLWDETAKVSRRTDTPASASSSPKPETRVATSKGATIIDLLAVELMHYYMLHTSVSILTHPGDGNGILCLQATAPKAGLTFPPLLHAIFALTCLHIHSVENDFIGTKSERNYLELANQFLAQCIEELHPYEPGKAYDADVDEPYFLTFTFLTLISIGHPEFGLSTFAPGPAIDPDFIQLDHPLGWMASTRFFQLNMYRHWDPYAGYKQKPPLLSGAVMEFNGQPTYYDNLLPFPEMLPLITYNGAPDSEELRDHNLQRVYEDAVKQVRHLWAISFQTYSEHIHLTTWPSLMSPVFFQLIMDRKPRALVIFANYCTLLGQFQDKWVTRNRGRADTRAILEMVGQEWYPYMRAPLSQLHAPEEIGYATPRFQRLVTAF